MSEARPVHRWPNAAPPTGMGVSAGAHLVLADELLDPRVDRLGHPHGGRAVHDARARRQLQRCGRLEEAGGEEERSHGERRRRGV